MHNEIAIDTYLQNFSGAVLNALAASNPERGPYNDTRALLPAGIQASKSGCGDSVRLPGPPSESRGKPPAEVGNPRFNECKNDKWRKTKHFMRVPTPSPRWST